MHCIARLLTVAVISCSMFVAVPSQAITINLDYTYDTSNFFGAGNPDGAAAGLQARNALESAANYFSGILVDTFSSIETPATFYSVPFNGVVSWEWQMDISNPSTGGVTSLFDETIADDEYRIYVGARSLAGNTLGVGGPGGWGWSSTPSGGFGPGEIDQVTAITNAFYGAIATRGEAFGFANWGGSLTFDSDGSTTWHTDHTTPTAAGENDFYSVAIHEIGHTLGLGTSYDWNAAMSGNFFSGPAATAEYGGLIPLDCIGGCTGHWAEGTTSIIQGTAFPQEAAMDPTLTAGTRKRLTTLDSAALTDIGWSVDSPTFSPGDYDYDGDVDDKDFQTFETWFGVNGNGDTDGDGDTDGIDFLTWQRNFTGGAAPIIPAFSPIVPEPNTAVLMLLGAGLLWRRRFL